MAPPGLLEFLRRNDAAAGGPKAAKVSQGVSLLEKLRRAHEEHARQVSVFDASGMTVTNFELESRLQAHNTALADAARAAAAKNKRLAIAAEDWSAVFQRTALAQKMTGARLTPQEAADLIALHAKETLAAHSGHAASAYIALRTAETRVRDVGRQHEFFRSETLPSRQTALEYKLRALKTILAQAKEIQANVGRISVQAHPFGGAANPLFEKHATVTRTVSETVDAIERQGAEIGKNEVMQRVKHFLEIEPGKGVLFLTPNGVHAQILTAELASSRGGSTRLRNFSVNNLGELKSLRDPWLESENPEIVGLLRTKQAELAGRLAQNLASRNADKARAEMQRIRELDAQLKPKIQETVKELIKRHFEEGGVERTEPRAAIERLVDGLRVSDEERRILKHQISVVTETTGDAIDELRGNLNYQARCTSMSEAFDKRNEPLVQQILEEGRRKLEAALDADELLRRIDGRQEMFRNALEELHNELPLVQKQVEAGAVQLDRKEAAGAVDLSAELIAKLLANHAFSFTSGLNDANDLLKYHKWLKETIETQHVSVAPDSPAARVLNALDERPGEGGDERLGRVMALIKELDGERIQSLRRGDDGLTIKAAVR